MKSYRNKLKLTKLLRAICRLLPAMLVCSALISSTPAQQGGTTSYVYDDNGRLHAVISPSGEAVVYEYDAAGNITSIRRLAGCSGNLQLFTARRNARRS